KLDDIYSLRLSNLTQIPTAGIVFKRPQANMHVGIMVEQLGLKGKQIGDEQISPNHVCIIVNIGKSTCQNILDLIEFI
ncbi:UDP-N-acetylmuramate dehydrogenase, partial [Francisella tularensis subsp. holarctica]|nr:UDP-N-acetylmuramate dehydrogenase [Francisella tularensis subsp. holarctica]